jgi:hypothetical protein
MQIVQPGFVIEDEIDGAKILLKLEKDARTCYKSEGFGRQIYENGEQFSVSALPKRLILI